MAIRVVCECGRWWDLEDRFAGTRMYCPTCKKHFRVPETDLDVLKIQLDPEDVGETPEAEPLPEPEPLPKNKKVAKLTMTSPHPELRPVPLGLGGRFALVVLQVIAIGSFASLVWSPIIETNIQSRRESQRYALQNLNDLAALRRLDVEEDHDYLGFRISALSSWVGLSVSCVGIVIHSCFRIQPRNENTPP